MVVTPGMPLPAGSAMTVSKVTTLMPLSTTRLHEVVGILGLAVRDDHPVVALLRALVHDILEADIVAVGRKHVHLDSVDGSFADGRVEGHLENLRGGAVEDVGHLDSSCS